MTGASSGWRETARIYAALALFGVPLTIAYAYLRRRAWKGWR